MAKLAFLGSPPIAVTALKALIDAGHEIEIVVSGADRRRSRGSELSPTPVKAYAQSVGIAVTETVADVINTDAELGIVVAFGKIIRPNVLAEMQMVNTHFSLLPRWRGAAPVERAILAGDKETGVCIMGVEEGLDTGDVYLLETIGIDDKETATQLRDRLGDVASALLVKAVAGGKAGLPTPTPQVGEANYAEKITAADLALSFDEPAVMSHRRTRVGKAFCTFRGKRLIVPEATTVVGGPTGDYGEIIDGRVATSDGWFVPITVRPEGKSDQAFDQWLRGMQVKAGEKLNS